MVSTHANVREQELAGLRWLVVSGPREDAFRALGQAAAEDIRAVQEAMPERAALRRWTATPAGAARLDRVLAATRAAHPGELAELSALAEGARADADELLLANLRGDLGTGDGTGCTDLAWSGGGRSLVAHNEDGAPALRDRLTLLTLLIDGQTPVTSAWYPGFLPANTFAATGHGLVWGINHVQVVAPTAADGAGRHFTARALQQAPTLDAALDLLRTRPTAGGFAYTLGERATGRVAVAEAADGRCAVVEAEPGDPTLHWHTNHLRHLPDPPDTAADSAGAATSSLGLYAESESRGRVLADLCPPRSHPQQPDPAWFLDVLTGAPVPKGVHRTADGDDPLMTLCTTVADLTADRITVCGASGATADLPLTDFVQGRC